MYETVIPPGLHGDRLGVQIRAAEQQLEVPKKPRGRLPAYFAAVVTTKQRETIYEIQATFNAQIEELRQQIATLEAQRNKDVDAVLSPDQMAETLTLFVGKLPFGMSVELSPGPSQNVAEE